MRSIAGRFIGARLVVVVAGFACVPWAIHAAGSPATAVQGRLQRVTGTITDVRAEDNELKVQTHRGQTISLTVDKQSGLTLQAKPAKLKQFAKGMRVRVVYQPLDGKNRVVDLHESFVTGADVARRLQEALRTFKEYTVEQKADYQQRLERVVEDLHEQIDELQERADQAGTDAKQRYAPQLEELRRQQETAREKLARVRDATPAMWDDIKSGVDAAVTDLERSLEQARSRIK